MENLKSRYHLLRSRAIRIHLIYTEIGHCNTRTSSIGLAAIIAGIGAGNQLLSVSSNHDYTLYVFTCALIFILRNVMLWWILYNQSEIIEMANE